MPNAIERALATALRGPWCDVGEIRITIAQDAFVLFHREDAGRADLEPHHSAEDALGLARFDDAGKYRPLRTAPNLAHGWELRLATVPQVQCALDYFYPGRLAVWVAAQSGWLVATPLRETLERQTGMYRAAARISDAQISDVVGNFCRSNGGCLRTILWKRDESGQTPSSELPPEKFDPRHDDSVTFLRAGLPGAAVVLPLLCQEACNLLVGECRKMVQAGKTGEGR